MPKINDETRVGGVLFFDDTCGFCRAWIGRVRAICERRGVFPRPFENGAAESEMRLRWHDGREFGGADALVFLAGRVWWATPVWLLAWVPGARGLMRAVYRMIAENRHCRAGACSLGAARPVGRRRLWPDFLLIAGPVVVVGMVGRFLPPWAWMWSLAAAMWLGFKLSALRRVPAAFRHPGRAMAFFAWPGMDASAFFGGAVSENPVPVEGALYAIILGVMTIWGLTPHLAEPVARGWLGMLGMILLLHFGTFALLAAGLRRAGLPVRPIMDAPWRARTLAEFWGARWNRAFSDMARVLVFRPLTRRLGIAAGTLGGFAASGLAHEIVISLPAGAGFGGPTAYFLLQGFGVLAERRFGWKSRAFVRAVTLPAAAILFHPPFLRRVIVPFLDLIA
ncbi:MAG: DUF393 domain-containing protein [Akkermansiaceae bacterium]|nr:DUF393 domain-containing protein [Akkermansiaceae bacterium]MCP5549725.1 DUF393 domain-containing protein [Akkermansiaceae bacterium]